ncbi:protein MEI2-like 5 isoform X1 [Pistacia vera]|uniref:protein MEI2-like 5 isoform X1 n=1 Tax=Pistacia vera TaxID=55513 RepID=UPI001263C01D|nr:protein MEI2-like 5 isoform X1 [Pistacia vera]XP_031284499.1 protein MEI2-like 5 isoform X1 [Pistacia vera]XP_031284500.1 protein MEI2-like 5 isoform X1 [Pistacia vera]
MGDSMKQTFDNSSGTTKIPPLSMPKELGSGVWGTIARSDAYHASSDASLFSSSLPVLPHEKLNLNVAGLGRQSVDDISSDLNKDHQGVEGGDSIEDNANSVTEGFLPDDEEELLAGIMDDFDLSGLPSSLEDLEDYDLFDSGGGMELENSTQESLSISMSKVSLSDGVVGNGLPHYGLPNGVGTVAGEHPYGEHPSRTLFVRNINSNVEDSELRALFEQYGDIRTLYTACKHRGFVMISYYDIRAARTAMRSLQNKPLRRRKLDIHFSIPKDNPSDKDLNQGTLVVFNLDPSVSNEDLRQIFGAYGEVKEIRETPHKRHHKFIEFYDVRAAEAALKSLNRSDIAGKRIKLEPSRPGGARRNFTSDSIKAFGTTKSLMLQLNQELEQDESRVLQHQVGSPITNSPPGNWGQFSSPIEPNPLQAISKSPVYRNISPTTSSLPGLASILNPPVSNSVKVAPIGKDQGRGSHMEHVFTNTNSAHGAAFPESHSFPEPKLGQHPGTISSFGTSTSNGSVMETLSGSQFLWGSPNRYSEHGSSPAWPMPTMGHPFSSNGKSHGFPYSGRQGSFLGSAQHHHHHHVGSAPSGVPLERHFGFFPESPETSFMNPVAFRGMGIGQNDGSFMVNHLGPRATVNPGITIPRNISENGSSSYRMMSSPRLSPVFVSNGLYPGLTPTNMEGLTDRGRSRRVDNNGSQIDTKKQFQLDLEKIKNGEDTRATLMIKNIPNKYTSKMLLAAIDENHKGTYDFLYLPIDFKNKCNVGYAFINMLSPAHIIPFYEAFNGKKWEKFNSEKVASLAYARIQGKAALVAHFQNSSLMNEDKRCRPIMFHSEGPDAGDQIIQEHMISNSLNIQVRQPNESEAGDSSGSPTKDRSGEKPEKS